MELYKKGLVYQNSNSDWYFRMSKYNDVIERDFEKLSLWPKGFRTQLLKIVNKTVGANVDFTIIIDKQKNSKEFNVEVYTERPETLNGVTFITVNKNSKIYTDIMSHIDAESKTYKIIEEGLLRHATFKLPDSIFAINPMNNEKIPIVVTTESNIDITASVPAHDEMAFSIAKKYSIPIKIVLKPINDMKDLISNKSEEEKKIGNIILPSNKQMQDLNLTKINIKPDNVLDNPIIINEDDGFLINNREFDFLFMDEARELITNNLAKKNKARKIINYKIKDWQITQNKTDKNNNQTPMLFCSKCMNNITENHSNTLPDHNPIKCKSCKEELKPVYLNDSFSAALLYLRYLDKGNNSELLGYNIFKKWLPVDICITDDQYTSLYYLYIYRFVLDFYKIDIDEKMKHLEFEEVFTSKEHELEKELCLPSPFKEMIIIQQSGNKTFDITQELSIKGVDRLRLFLLLSLNSFTPSSNIKINNMIGNFISTLNDINNKVTNSLSQSTKGWELDYVIENMIKVNKSENGIVTDMLKNFLSLFLELESRKFDSAAEKIINITETFTQHINKGLLDSMESKHCIYLLYTQLLLCLYPFCPFISCELYSHFLEKNVNKNLPLYIFQYSIEKLINSCNFYIEMLNNSVMLSVKINNKDEGYIIIDKKLSTDQKEVLSEIREKIQDIKENEIKEYILDEENSRIIIIN